MKENIRVEIAKVSVFHYIQWIHFWYTHFCNDKKKKKKSMQQTHFRRRLWAKYAGKKSDVFDVINQKQILAHTLFMDSVINDSFPSLYQFIYFAFFCHFWSQVRKHKVQKNNWKEHIEWMFKETYECNCLSTQERNWEISGFWSDTHCRRPVGLFVICR